MLVKDKQITETEILRICKQRENEENISFEEAYFEVLEYNPTI